MAFTDQATLAKDATFQDRIRIAAVTAARDVMGEDQGEASDQEFGKRQHLAYSVLTNSGLFVERFAWAVAANAAITDSSTDGDIQFTVNSMFSDVAGVTSTD